LSFPVGVDSEDGATFKLYCDTTPYCLWPSVFKADGSLAWAGHPDWHRVAVVKRPTTAPSASPPSAKITALRTELQTALRCGCLARRDPQITPTGFSPSTGGDMIAIQAKLSFSTRGQGALTEARELPRK
jgi:hypothetical protein